MTASVWNPGSNNIPLVDPLSQIKSQVFNATEGQTTFVITQFTYTPGNGALTIYVNRAKLVAADITEVNTTTFSIPACEVDDVVEVVANTAIQDPSSAVAQAVAAAAAASLSESNAAISESNAATSESNAATSETNAATSAALAATYVPMDWREAWVTAVAYVINDGVSINGKSYVCREAHTSGVFATDLGAGKWQLIADRGSDGTNGTNGLNGADGRGIVSVVRTSGTGAPGTADTYTITYTDATTSTYQVWNGTNGTGSGDMIAANNLSDLTNVATARTNLGLGSAATQNSSAFATAAQGTKADSALQPAAIGVSVEAYDATILKSASIGVTVQGYDADTAKLDIAQNWTGVQRSAGIADNDLSFNLNAANNFTCTTTGAGTLTFTNLADGKSGYVLLVNSGGYAISKASSVKAGSSFLTTISAAGTYLISYYSNATSVYVTASGSLS